MVSGCMSWMRCDAMRCDAMRCDAMQMSMRFSLGMNIMIMQVLFHVMRKSMAMHGADETVNLIPKVGFSGTVGS